MNAANRWITTWFDWPSAWIGAWQQAQRTLSETWQAAPEVVALRLVWLSTPPMFWTAGQHAEFWRMIVEKQRAVHSGFSAMNQLIDGSLLDHPVNQSTLPARLVSAGVRPAHRRVRNNLSRLRGHHDRPAVAARSI